MYYSIFQFLMNYPGGYLQGYPVLPDPLNDLQTFGCKEQGRESVHDGPEAKWLQTYAFLAAKGHVEHTHAGSNWWRCQNLSQ